MPKACYLVVDELQIEGPINFIHEWYVVQNDNQSCADRLPFLKRLTFIGMYCVQGFDHHESKESKYIIFKFAIVSYWLKELRPWNYWRLRVSCFNFIDNVTVQIINVKVIFNKVNAPTNNIFIILDKLSQYLSWFPILYARQMVKCGPQNWSPYAHELKTHIRITLATAKSEFQFDSRIMIGE